MPSKYSIKDLERLSGIKAHTLRIWEQRYEILNPQRTGTNIRYYNSSDLKKILNISLLNNNGYKISNIAKLNEERLLEEVDKFLNIYVKESDQIENLVLCLMDMDEERFERTVNNAIHHFGFENTIEKVVFPFLRHIGNMWQIGIVNPAQEHYISNLIRQKIIVAIDKANSLKPHTEQTCIFFLPQQEFHELGILYTWYLSRTRGHKCIYLGQSVPFEDLVTVSKTLKPDYIVSIFTTKMQDTDINDFLSSCSEKIPGPQFLVSGRLLFDSGEQAKMPSGRFTAFENYKAYTDHLNTL